jgi:oligopeptide transport system substrate-binding protein
MAVLTVGAMVLGACAPAETKVETVVVTQVVVETVEIEVAGEVQTVEVTKEVEVEVTREVVVEVEKEEPVDDRVVLNWNLGTEPPTLDPSLATDTTSVDVVANLFVGLTRFHPETGLVEPWLATDWDISEDGTVYTFHLRDDIQWVKYNGLTGEVEVQGPVTAADVEYGVKRTVDPNTASDYAYVLYVIKNAAAINGGEEGVTIDDLGVKALDDTTVEFTLEYPAAYFPAIAGMWVAKPMPMAPIDEFGDKWTEPNLQWSNGPYVLTEWVHGGAMRLEKNPYWIEADDVQIEVVDMVMIVEASTAFAMYENNELDTTGVPLPEIDRVKADPVLSLEFVNAADVCTYYYGFTHTKPPFDDVRVRTAFSAAIDRQTLIDTVIKGGQIPATSFAPPGIFGAPPPGTVGLGYDVEVATAALNEFLTENGLADGQAMVDEYDISLGHNTSEGHARIAAAIQAMWAANIGVNTRVENQEWAVYLNTVGKTTPVEEVWHVWRMGWCADYPDENNWVREVFHYEEGANRLRRQCADPNCGETIGPGEFDTLVVDAALESDPAKRAEMYERAEDLLARENANAAFIYHYTIVSVTKPWLQRDYPLLGGNNFYDWKIDWDAKKAAKGM